MIPEDMRAGGPAPGQEGTGWEKEEDGKRFEENVVGRLEKSLRKETEREQSRSFS